LAEERLALPIADSGAPDERLRTEPGKNRSGITVRLLAGADP